MGPVKGRLSTPSRQMHISSSHCSEVERTVQRLNCLPQPPQGILRLSAEDQEGADGGGIAK
jgi:hypothetical protein